MTVSATFEEVDDDEEDDDEEEEDVVLDAVLLISMIGSSISISSISMSSEFFDFELIFVLSDEVRLPMGRGGYSFLSIASFLLGVVLDGVSALILLRWLVSPLCVE